MRDDSPLLVMIPFFAFIIVCSVIFARCEHRTDNRGVMVVRHSTSKGKFISEYEAMEDNWLANRYYFTDSTGKFNVGDTVLLRRK